MKDELLFHGKPMQIELSESAKKAAQTLDSRLIIEIQIYFSCLLGKRLAYYVDQPMAGSWQVAQQQFAEMIDDSQSLKDKLYIRSNTRQVHGPVNKRVK